MYKRVSYTQRVTKRRVTKPTKDTYLIVELWAGEKELAGQFAHGVGNTTLSSSCTSLYVPGGQLCMYVHMTNTLCLCTYICIHICMYTYIHVYICIYSCTTSLCPEDSSVHVHPSSSLLNFWVQTKTHMHAFACMYVCMYVFLFYLNVCRYMKGHACIHNLISTTTYQYAESTTLARVRATLQAQSRMCRDVFMYTFMYVCIHHGCTW